MQSKLLESASGVSGAFSAELCGRTNFNSYLRGSDMAWETEKNASLTQKIYQEVQAEVSAKGQKPTG